MTDREHDIVLFGATGFVGRLIAAHLAEHADVRVALAGRSLAKLNRLRVQLPPAAREWPVIVADSKDDASLRALAESTTVVASTVGPYLRYGLPLVRACAEAGTDYADLTGETLFVRQCIDRFESVAQASGARIVNSCGFDSIPSDLGVFLAAEQARADGAGQLTDTTLIVRSMRGGVSGGTIDSLRAQTEAFTADPTLRRVVADPYALSPNRSEEPQSPADRDDVRVHHDAELGWTGPFVMASYNTRIVRRSNALQKWAYGRDFHYREVMGFGTSPIAPLVATGMSAGLGAFAVGMSHRASRLVLDRFLPAPGAGPGEKARRNGRFRLEVHAGTTSGVTYISTVAATGDPGYAATAVMFGQSALALAATHADRNQGGVRTPATALGSVLVERLRAAGMTLDVRRAG